MSDIDWDSFPKATHYTPKRSGIYAAYWRKEGDKWAESWVIGRDGCIEHYTTTSGPTCAKNAVPRPLSAWNGEGLPPVGIDVEVILTSNKPSVWHHATVLAHHDGQAVLAVHMPDLSYRYTAERREDMRSVRTPEQLAAERRAEAIKRALDLLEFRDHYTQGVLEILYDNGLLKGSDDQ